MKKKAQALAVELALIDLEAAKEDLVNELDKNDKMRRTGLAIIIISFLVGVFFFLVFMSRVMVIISVIVMLFGLYLREGSTRYILKQKIKENHAKVRELKKSLLQLKYEE